jgi:single-stranded-DNA-specific exonuclease
MIERARFLDPRGMGEGKHLRFTVESGGARARCVRFGEGTKLPVADGELVRASFALEVNEWNGVVEPRLRLRHAESLAPTLPAPGATPAADAPRAPRGVASQQHTPHGGAGEQLALL